MIVRWRDWSGTGCEHLVLRQPADGITAEAVVVSPVEDGFGARYRVRCDPAWRVREVEVDVMGDDRRVRLVVDGDGRWRDDLAGRPLPALDHAIDVDLAFTPFTNTLPIRRLGLKDGESAEIVVAYLKAPELTPIPDPQRYTCLEAGRRYRFESLDSDFVREIAVDAHGLVVTYPDLFQRIA